MPSFSKLLEGILGPSTRNRLVRDRFEIVHMALTNLWVISREGDPDAELTLYCFPYAGGGASAFRRWKEDLPRRVEVARIQLPGRENRIRERPLSSMHEVAPALAEGILQSADRPFAFYGHSLGARIAFETARALRRKGSAQPCHLFVGASDAPQFPWPHPLLHQLPEDEFIDAMQQRYGGVPQQIIDDPELRALLIPTLRADVELMETYRYTPEPPLECAVTAFAGAKDNMVSRDMVDGWRDQTNKRFQLYLIPGNHFFLHAAQKKLLDVIAAESQADLEGTSAY
jgi:medium-chain acyl-[acyl-carrier-protein] hydrolase